MNTAQLYITRPDAKYPEIHLFNVDDLFERVLLQSFLLEGIDYGWHMEYIPGKPLIQTEGDQMP